MLSFYLVNANLADVEFVVVEVVFVVDENTVVASAGGVDRLAVLADVDRVDLDIVAGTFADFVFAAFVAFVDCEFVEVYVALVAAVYVDAVNDVSLYHYCTVTSSENIFGMKT